MNGSVSSSWQRLKPERGHLVADMVAALTFAVVNVPQAMGHALLAMVNPVLGIYTLMVAVPVGAIFSSSVFMNVSTTGALLIGAAGPKADKSKLFRSMMAWGFAMSVFGAVLSWFLFTVLKI
jgi:MFS superfamily sulfate permease-like transporter